MVDYLRQKAIQGPWAASERLLACVGADEVSERVVRRAAQLATSLNAAWTAVTIEPLVQEADARKANQIAKTFSLAERLGGDTMRLQGSDYPARSCASPAARTSPRSSSASRVPDFGAA